MKELALATIIGEFILLRKAFYPNITIGVTTEKAYNKFKDKIESGENIGQLPLTALEDAVMINRDPAINALPTPEQSLLAVANDMYKENNELPIIVVRPEAAEKWKTDYSYQFYTEHKDAKYKVDIYNMLETIIHIKSKHATVYEQVIANLEQSDNPLLKVNIRQI